MTSSRADAYRAGSLSLALGGSVYTQRESGQPAKALQSIFKKQYPASHLIDLLHPMYVTWPP